MNSRRNPHPAVVIAFTPPVDRRPRTARTTPAELIDLATYRRALDQERGDAAWDRLEELGRAAWTWRDPESVAALEASVERLRLAVRDEWQIDRPETPSQVGD